MASRPLEPGFIALHTLLSVSERVITITPAIYGVEDLSEAKSFDQRSPPVQEQQEVIPDADGEEGLPELPPILSRRTGTEASVGGESEGVQCTCGACNCPLRWLHGEDLQ